MNDELFRKAWTTMWGGVKEAAGFYEPEALGALKAQGSRKRTRAGALRGLVTVTGCSSGDVVVDNASGYSLISRRKSI